MAFVHLTKAFYTVSRFLPWNILRIFCGPHTFIAILQQFHSGMSAQVVMAGSQSSSFPVDVGVKQDSVLDPIIFIMFLFPITLLSDRDPQAFDCVYVGHRHDGGLFNLQRH